MMGSPCHGDKLLSGIRRHRLRYSVPFSHLLPGLVLFVVRGVAIVSKLLAPYPRHGNAVTML